MRSATDGYCGDLRIRTAPVRCAVRKNNESDGGGMIFDEEEGQPRQGEAKVLTVMASEMMLCIPSIWDNAVIEAYATLQAPGKWSVQSREECNEGRKKYDHVTLKA